jgi:hypothetical protein
MKHDWAKMYIDPFDLLALGRPDFLLCACGARANSPNDPILSADNCPREPKISFFEVK